MKTAQSFRIHFVLRGYLAKNGKAPLDVSVTVNKEKCLIGLKQSIDLNNWDTEKGIPKGNREQVKLLNNYLDEVKLALGNCYKELMLKGRLPSATAVKNLYLGEADEG
ncbi:MAG TPA: Arm DNA-binding domain-containing protein, partial [Hanamia sp.]